MTNVDEIFAKRLDIVPFYHAMRHLSDTYSEARGDRGAESPEEGEVTPEAPADRLAKKGSRGERETHRYHVAVGSARPSG